MLKIMRNGSVVGIQMSQKLRKPSASKSVVLGLQEAKSVLNEAIETMNRDGIGDRDLTTKSKSLRNAHDWIDRFTAWYWARKDENAD